MPTKTLSTAERMELTPESKTRTTGERIRGCFLKCLPSREPHVYLLASLPGRFGGRVRGRLERAGPCFVFALRVMKTWVYVDGLNLFYGCLKGTPFKWLDLHRLSAQLLRGHQIDRIKYFTA